VTPLYPQKLALNSPTGGGRSVGIVRSRTKATELQHSSFRVTHLMTPNTFRTNCVIIRSSEFGRLLRN